MTDELLKEHQAIIDAWYQKWRDRQRERLERLFESKGLCPHGYKDRRACERCSDEP